MTLRFDKGNRDKTNSCHARHRPRWLRSGLHGAAGEVTGAAEHRSLHAERFGRLEPEVAGDGARLGRDSAAVRDRDGGGGGMYGAGRRSSSRSAGVHIGAPGHRSDRAHSFQHAGRRLRPGTHVLPYARLHRRGGRVSENQYPRDGALIGHGRPVQLRDPRDRGHLHPRQLGTEEHRPDSVRSAVQPGTRPMPRRHTAEWPIRRS